MKMRNLLPSQQTSYGVSSPSKDTLHAEEKCPNESRERGWKCRHSIMLIGLSNFFFLMAYRMTMSVGIVAMVNNSAIVEDTKIKSDSCPDLIVNASKGQNLKDIKWEGEFVWSPQIQGYVLSSYFIGIAIMQFPGGLLAERFGCKRILLFASFITSISTLLIPLVSWWSVYALIALQTVRGLAQGPVPPAISVLVANWFPRLERGFAYTTVQSGNSLGSCLTSVFTGLLCDSAVGWPSSFYVFGSAGMILTFFVMYFMFENPKVHPRISKAELDFILTNQEGMLSQRRPNPPWGKILTSVPVYALSYGCFGQLWAISQFLIVHSTFLGTILHYPIAANGFFTSVPFLLQFLCSQVAGWLSSYMQKKNLASVDFLRKFWNLMSSLGFSVCLLGIYFAGCNRTLSIIFAVLSTGFTGLGYAGSWIVATDMSPTFAGSVFAIALTFGSMSSVILPLIVGYLTDEMQTIEQWNKVIFISIGIVLSSGILFAIFGSAEVQPWNYAEDVSKGDESQEKIEKNPVNNATKMTRF